MESYKHISKKNPPSQKKKKYLVKYLEEQILVLDIIKVKKWHKMDIPWEFR